MTQPLAYPKRPPTSDELVCSDGEPMETARHVQQMTVQLRSGILARKPEPQLEGVVECDEVYVVAGHKGHPEAVKKRVGPDAAAA